MEITDLDRGDVCLRVGEIVKEKVELEEEVKEKVKEKLYVNAREKLRPVSCEVDILRDVTWNDVDSMKL